MAYFILLLLSLAIQLVCGYAIDTTRKNDPKKGQTACEKCSLSSDRTQFNLNKSFG